MEDQFACYRTNSTKSSPVKLLGDATAATNADLGPDDCHVLTGKLEKSQLGSKWAK
jgi:hypothetical protein